MQKYIKCWCLNLWPVEHTSPAVNIQTYFQNNFIVTC